MRNIYNWGKVDWLNQDVVIAKQLGCSRQRVSQKRKEFRKTPSPFSHKRNSSISNKILKFDTEKMTLDEITEKMGCTRLYIRNILIQHKKPFICNDKRKRGKYEWGTANWTKTDKEVAHSLGVPNVGTVTQHRRRMGIIKRRSTAECP